MDCAKAYPSAVKNTLFTLALLRKKKREIGKVGRGGGGGGGGGGLVKDWRNAMGHNFTGKAPVYTNLNDLSCNFT